MSHLIWIWVISTTDARCFQLVETINNLVHVLLSMVLDSWALTDLKPRTDFRLKRGFQFLLFGFCQRPTGTIVWDGLYRTGLWILTLRGLETVRASVTKLAWPCFDFRLAYPRIRLVEGLLADMADISSRSPACLPSFVNRLMTNGIYDVFRVGTWMKMSNAWLDSINSVSMGDVQVLLNYQLVSYHVQPL